MKKVFFRYAPGCAKFSAMAVAALMLFAAAVYPVYAQEESSANLILLPSQERIPRADGQPRIDPAYIIPPIGGYKNPPAESRATAATPLNAPTPAKASTPASASASSASASAAPASKNAQQLKTPLINSLERGKWYVQIGAYAKIEHMVNAVNRVGTDVPVVVHNAGTDAGPMYRVLLGPFSQSESKTVLQRFKDKGYDAFLRNG